MSLLLLALSLSLSHRFPLHHCCVIPPPSHHFPFSALFPPLLLLFIISPLLLFIISPLLLFIISPTPPLRHLAPPPHHFPPPRFFSSSLALLLSIDSPPGFDLPLGSPPCDVLSLLLPLSLSSSFFCRCQVLGCSNFVRWVNGGRMGENRPRQTSWPIFAMHHTGL